MPRGSVGFTPGNAWGRADEDDDAEDARSAPPAFGDAEDREEDDEEDEVAVVPFCGASGKLMVALASLEDGTTEIGCSLSISRRRRDAGRSNGANGLVLEATDDTEGRGALSRLAALAVLPVLRWLMPLTNEREDEDRDVETGTAGAPRPITKLL